MTEFITINGLEYKVTYNNKVLPQETEVLVSLRKQVSVNHNDFFNLKDIATFLTKLAKEYSSDTLITIDSLSVDQYYEEDNRQICILEKQIETEEQRQKRVLKEIQKLEIKRINDTKTRDKELEKLSITQKKTLLKKLVAELETKAPPATKKVAKKKVAKKKVSKKTGTGRQTQPGQLWR